MKSIRKIIFVFLFLSILIFPTNAMSQTIPDWVRTTAYWWSQGEISDSEYKNAMKFLIENGIITISNQHQNQNVIDKGDFYVIYYEPSNPRYEPIMTWAIENEEWLVNLSGINFIKLPYDIEIAFEQCDEINAYYSSYYKTITICYELIETTIGIQSQYYNTEEEIAHASQDAIYEALLHELGHGLIDIYDIPVTGKEEDAVDQLAMIILLQEGQQGVNALYAVANWYDYFGSQVEEVEELPFHDEHSLDMQRFYNILCFVYGADPENNYWLADYLPSHTDTERWAWLCVEEHEKISDSWNRFLDPLWNY